MTALYVPLAGDVPSAAELATFVPIGVRKAADEAIANNTSHGLDAALFVPVAANASYEFRLFLMLDSPAAAGFQFLFTAPSGSTLDWTSDAVDGGTILNATYNAEKRAITDFSGGSLTFGAGTIQVIRPSGWLAVGSTAGTFGLLWAQHIANAGTTTVRAGSFLVLQQTA